MPMQRDLNSSTVSDGFFWLSASWYFSWILATDSASTRAWAGSYTPHGRSQCAWTTRRGLSNASTILNMTPPSTNAASRETYHRPRKAMFLGILALGYAAARLRPFRIEVDGDSMRPTLEPGDWCLATAGGRVRKGDVVVVDRPDRASLELVKRVTGAPGESGLG